MSEERMVELVQDALAERGIHDDVVAAGQLNPRGHVGGLFAGGLVGGDAGDAIGGVAGSIGTGVGSLAGMKAVDAASGMPGTMLVGVTDATVYAWDSRSRSKAPGPLVFEVPRGGLTVKIHQRVNVRVLELIDEASGSRIELEGSRVPVTHAKDVMHALSG